VSQEASQSTPGSAPRSARASVLNSAMPRPLIGVTLDAEKPGGYSKFPWYALRQNYLDAIDAAGGLAVALPHESPIISSESMRWW
jgi:hypothetical protein